VLKMEDVFAVFDKTIIDIIIEEPLIRPTKALAVGLLGDRFGGVLLFLVWFVVIIVTMGMITKGLEKIIEMEWEDKVKAAFENPYRGFATGFGITFLVGSSSIGSSLVIPFLATKVVDLKKAYPYLVGCNMATTVDLSQIYGYVAGGVVGMILGSAHVLLNILALTIWLISPLRSVPVKIAEWLGDRIAQNKNAAYALLAWVVAVFFVIPILVIYLF